MGTRTLVAVCIAWGLCVAGGFLLLYVYKAQPGANGAPPERWPSTRLALDPTRPTLVMVAHPHCPCTRASVSELARLLARLDNQVRTHVLFVRPDGVDDGWEHTDLWRSAARISGVTVSVDARGAEARRFGIETSGHVALYDPNGALLYQGGITSARGHEGDSFGQRRIASLLATRNADRPDAPVFGCALFEPNTRRSTETP